MVMPGKRSSHRRAVEEDGIFMLGVALEVGFGAACTLGF